MSTLPPTHLHQVHFHIGRRSGTFTSNIEQQPQNFHVAGKKENKKEKQDIRV